jgi:hypothetical protein
MIYPFEKQVDKSKWKREPQFGIEHISFEYWISLTLFIQVGLCVFVMIYLTVHREVPLYWKYIYIMERIFGS